MEQSYGAGSMEVCEIENVVHKASGKFDKVQGPTLQNQRIPQPQEASQTSAKWF